MPAREPAVEQTADQSVADLGVVIVNYNAGRLLTECVESVVAEAARVSQDVSTTIWVVDNDSTDGSLAAVRESFPDVTVVALGDNRGYAAGANTALEAWRDTDMAAALILNPDTRLLPGSLTALVAAVAPEVVESAPHGGRGDRVDRQAERAPGPAGLAGPALEYPDGRFQHAAFHFPGVIQTVLDLYTIDRLADSTLNGRYPRARYRAGRPFAVDFPLGACLMARMEAVADVGLMDPSYFMYCEELDWAARFHAADWPVVLVPAARVVHHGGASTSQVPAAMNAALWRSRLQWFRTYLPRWKAWLLRALVRLAR